MNKGIRASLENWWARQDSHIVDLLRGASIAGALKALSALLAFGLSVVLGRSLGVDAAGAYFLAITIATVASTIGRIGLDSAVIRFVSTRAMAAAWADVRQTYGVTIKLSLICSVAISALVYVSAGFLSDKVFSGTVATGAIRISVIAIVPLSLGILTSGALLGMSRVRDSLLVLSILPSGIALIGVYLLAPRWGVSGALLAYSVAVTVALVFGMVAWHRGLAKLPATQQQESQVIVRRLIEAGMPLLLGALLQLVIHSSGTVMLGMWSERTDVSQYSVAWRTAALISFVLIAVNTIAQPKFAALYAQGNLAILATTARKANLIMTCFAVPMLALFLIAPSLMMSLFGEGFAHGAAVLQILAIGQFVNVAMGSVGVLLVMSANEREYRNVQIVSALLALVLNVVLIPNYGAVGAAVSAASALVVQNVLFGYYVWRRLGILMLSSQPYRPGKAEQ